MDEKQDCARCDGLLRYELPPPPPVHMICEKYEVKAIKERKHGILFSNWDWKLKNAMLKFAFNL